MFHFLSYLVLLLDFFLVYLSVQSSNICFTVSGTVHCTPHILVGKILSLILALHLYAVLRKLKRLMQINTFFFDLSRSKLGSIQKAPTAQTGPQTKGKHYSLWPSRQFPNLFCCSRTHLIVPFCFNPFTNIKIQTLAPIFYQICRLQIQQKQLTKVLLQFQAYLKD